jgi:hypothetical protein
VKLARGDLIGFDRIALAVECAHVLEEAVPTSGGSSSGARLIIDRRAR